MKPKPSRHPPPTRRQRTWRILFRRLRQGVFLFLFLVVALGSYVHFVGLPRGWTDAVLAELSKKGLYLEMGSIHLDPFRGVIARKVDFYPSARKTETLHLREIALHVSFWELLWKKISIPQLNMEGSEIQFTSTTLHEPILIKDVSGTLLFSEHHLLQLESIRGELYGIQFELEGTLDLKKPPPSVDSPQQPKPLNLEFFNRWKRPARLLSEGALLNLKLQVEGNPSQPSTLCVQAHVRGRRLEYREWWLDKLTANLTWSEKGLDLSNGMVESGGESINFSGFWVAQAAAPLSFEFYSKILPEKIFRPPSTDPRWKPWRSLRFGFSPEVWAKGTLDPRASAIVPTIQADFSVLLKNPEWSGFSLDEIRAVGRMDQGVLQIPALVIRKSDSLLQGPVSFDFSRGVLQFDIDSSLDIAAWIRIFYPSEKNWFHSVQFTRPPRTRLRGHWAIRDPNGLQATGDIDWKEWSSRGVPISSTLAGVKIDGKVFHFQELFLQRPEGAIRGDLTLDFAANRARINATSTIHCSELSKIIGPKAEESFRPYRFPSPPRLVISGSLGLVPSTPNDLRVQVEADQFQYWKLTASQVKAEVFSRDDCLEIARYQSQFYDGRLEANLLFDFTLPRRDWAVQCRLDQVDFDRFTHDLWEYNQVHGRMTATTYLQGTMESSKELSGQGEIKIADGVLWRIPLFGELSKFIPILGEHRATKGTATFTVGEERVCVDEMHISAGLMSLTAKGNYRFDRSLDFIVQGHFLRGFFGIGYVLDPLTKAFEYHLGGKLDRREWEPRFIPKELLFQFNDKKDSNGEGETPSPPDLP